MVSVEYNTATQVYTDIIIENVIVECYPCKDEYNEYAILSGIPRPTFNWIYNDIKRLIGNGITFDYVNRTKEHTWMDTACLLPQVIGPGEEIHVQMYRDDLKKFTTVGSLLDVQKRLKSNLVGFGQFNIYVKEDHVFEMFMTGFQLVDVTATRSFSQPEIEVSPPYHIIKALSEPHRD